MAVVAGTAQLRELGARLKAAGAVEIRLELIQALKEAAKPLPDAVKEAALADLPKTGGLNRQVAGQRVTTSVRLSGAVGVRLTTTAPDTAQTDAGYVRHPTFGHRDRWKSQLVPEATGWWSRTLSTKSAEQTPKILAAMELINLKVNAGLI